MACFLCANPNGEIHQRGGDMVWSVNCSLCGAYDITFTLAEDINANRPDFQILLPFVTAHLRQTSAAGLASPTLTTDNYRAAASGHMNTPVPVKLRKVLEYLGSRSSFPGDVVAVDPDAHPLFDVVQSGHLGFLLDTLVARGHVRRIGQTALGHPTWMVTAEGLEQLAPSGTGGTPGNVFVAMAFEADMNAAYDAAIHPAVVNDCGLTITHVGRVQYNDSINDVILTGLRAAQVVVADVTHQRNGVYFEGGSAMGLGRIVIWMCREDDLVNVHFDTRQYNHIVWTAHADLRTKLRDRIRGTVSVAAKMA